MSDEETLPDAPTISPALPDPDHHAQIFQRIRDAHQLELAEDYVELIADLIEATGEARLVDVAQRLGVTKSAASTTLNKLKRDGLVVSEKYRSIFLTEAGQALALHCKQRHDIVYRFLLKLGVPEEAAYYDSEGMEHHISAQTLSIMADFLGESLPDGIAEMPEGAFVSDEEETAGSEDTPFGPLMVEVYDQRLHYAPVEEVNAWDAALSGAPAPWLAAPCGSGRLVIPLASRGHIIEGLDRSEDMLRHLQLRAVVGGLEVEVREEDLQELEDNARYGAVFSAYQSFQLFDPEMLPELFARVHRALVPGGRFVFDATQRLPEGVPEPAAGEADFEALTPLEQRFPHPQGGEIVSQRRTQWLDPNRLIRGRTDYAWQKNGEIAGRECAEVMIWLHPLDAYRNALAKAGFSTVDEQPFAVPVNPAGTLFVARRD